MDLDELRAVATAAGLDSVPVALLHRLAALDLGSANEAVSAIYANQSGGLASIAAHGPLRVAPLGPVVAGRSDVDASRARSEARAADERGDPLAAATWWVSAALLDDNDADASLRRATRRLLAALDTAGARLVCGCADTDADAADWGYLVGRLAGISSNVVMARSMFATAWDLVGDDRPELAREIASHALAIETASGTPESMALWLERAAALTDGSASLDDVDLTTRLRLAALVIGSHDASAPGPMPSPESAHDTDDLDGLLGEAVTHHVGGRVDDSVRLAARNIEVAGRLGNVPNLLYGTAWLAAFEWRRGAWETAEALARSVAVAGSERARPFAACGAACLVAVEAVVGRDPGDGVRTLASAMALLPDSPALRAARDQALAWSQLVRLDLDAACATAVTWRGERFEELPLFGGVPMVRVGAIAAALGGADDDEVRRGAACLERSADPNERRWARLLRSLGDGEASALASLDDGWTWAVDRVLAAAVLTAGDVDAPGPRDVLAAEADRLTAQGAHGLAAFARGVPGLVATRRLQDRLAHLTPKELDVLAALRLGETNVQISRRLAVSTKSVEFHLTNVYRKLGVASRHELLARFAPSSDAGGT